MSSCVLGSAGKRPCSEEDDGFIAFVFDLGYGIRVASILFFGQL